MKMGEWHVYYPDFLVAPPHIWFITGFWSLLFWALLPLMTVTAALLIYVQFATEDNIWLGSILLNAWPPALIAGKWFEKCYGCWHVFSNMVEWEDDKKRHWCGVWVTLCGMITIFCLAAFSMLPLFGD